MKNETYDLLIRNLDELISRCKEVVSDFNGQEDVRNWTVREFESRLNQARFLASRQDAFFKGEHYHYETMCDFDDGQFLEYINRVKELGKTRPKLEILSKTTLTIPGVKPIHTYTGKVLPIELKKIDE